MNTKTTALDTYLARAAAIHNKLTRLRSAREWWRHHDTVTFHGQEKSDTNTKLARMNLVVHGLDASNIRQGNTL